MLLWCDMFSQDPGVGRYKVNIFSDRATVVGSGARLVAVEDDFNTNYKRQVIAFGPKKCPRDTISNNVYMRQCKMQGRGTAYDNFSESAAAFVAPPCNETRTVTFNNQDYIETTTVNTGTNAYATVSGNADATRIRVKLDRSAMARNYNTYYGLTANTLSPPKGYVLFVVPVEALSPRNGEPVSYTDPDAIAYYQTMSIQLSGSTKISFSGRHFTHGYVSSRFSNNSTTSLNLSVRARQFSAFVFTAGTIETGDMFKPQCAMIIQNKDELQIPLLLEMIPSPREFRDAMATLSPEQQRFAQANRAMQSTLFAMCLIPIKPQLERVLRRHPKEIRLSHDIMQLLVEFQIPTDLVAYDGDKNERKDKK